MREILNGALAVAQLLLQLGLLVAQPGLGCAFLLDAALQLPDDAVTPAGLRLGLLGLLLGADLGALGRLQAQLLGPNQTGNAGNQSQAQGDLAQGAHAGSASSWVWRA